MISSDLLNGWGRVLAGLGRSLRKDTLMQIHQAAMALDLEGGGPQAEVSGAAGCRVKPNTSMSPI